MLRRERLQCSFIRSNMVRFAEQQLSPWELPTKRVRRSTPLTGGARCERERAAHAGHAAHHTAGAHARTAHPAHSPRIRHQGVVVWLTYHAERLYARCCPAWESQGPQHPCDLSICGRTSLVLPTEWNNIRSLPWPALQDNVFWLGLLTHLQSDKVPLKSVTCLRDLTVSPIQPLM